MGKKITYNENLKEKGHFTTYDNVLLEFLSWNKISFNKTQICLINTIYRNTIGFRRYNFKVDLNDLSFYVGLNKKKLAENLKILKDRKVIKIYKKFQTDNIIEITFEPIIRLWKLNENEITFLNFIKEKNKTKEKQDKPKDEITKDDPQIVDDVEGETIKNDDVDDDEYDEDELMKQLDEM